VKRVEAGREICKESRIAAQRGDGSNELTHFLIVVNRRLGRSYSRTGLRIRRAPPRSTSGR
jgi:hypothetical protein